ncbi:MAG: GYD domain-containing protein [Candidatus Methylomirabilales bacterium]
MPTYMSLVSYTDQKSRTIKISPTRLDAAKKLLQEMGGELKDCYLTHGSYDLITVTEAPNEEVVAKFLRALDSDGNARGTTIKVGFHGRFSPATASQLRAAARPGPAEVSW